MKSLNRSLIGSAVFALAAVVGAPAHAAFFATICNDLACTGGDDITIQDNGAGDNIAALGGISFSTSAFGYSLLVNTSQSKPMIGSAAAPQLDLTFTATSNAAGGGNVFLYTSDTDFVSSGSFLLALGGTNSGGSGSVTGRAWGGSSNTALQFSGANLIGTSGELVRFVVLEHCVGQLLLGRQSLLADDRCRHQPHDGGHEHGRLEPPGVRDSGTRDVRPDAGWAC